MFHWHIRLLWEQALHPEWKNPVQEQAQQIVPQKSASDHSKSSVCSGGSLATGTPTSSIAASAEGDSDSSLRRKSRSSIANVGRGMSDSDIVNVRGSSNASEDSAVSTSGYNSQDSREGIS